jgi:hypothetical protein
MQQLTLPDGVLTPTTLEGTMLLHTTITSSSSTNPSSVPTCQPVFGGLRAHVCTCVSRQKEKNQAKMQQKNRSVRGWVDNREQGSAP